MKITLEFLLLNFLHEIVLVLLMPSVKTEAGLVSVKLWKDLRFSLSCLTGSKMGLIACRSGV